MINKILLTLFFLAFYSYAAISQQLSDSQIKSVFVYRFIDNIEWENEAKLKKFNIGVLKGDKEMTKALGLLSGKSVKKGAKIDVKNITTSSDFSGLQILYLPHGLEKQIATLFKKIEGKNILLISDRATDKQKVMINFKLPINKKIGFEINKANILNEGLKEKGMKALTILGGTELDIAKIYKESIVSLESEKTKVKKFKAEIEIQKKEIEKQIKAINKQKAEIDEQKAEIEKQKEQIKVQTGELNNLLEDIELKQEVLVRTLDSLSFQKEKLKIQEQAIVKQEEEMEERSSILKKQEAEIEEQEDKISTQSRTLMKQTATMAILKNLVLVAVVFILLFLGLAFLIYKSYRIKKEANKKLELKNAEISSQQEEILAQSENLSVANLALEHEKEYTQSSIRYGLTIQEAMLPDKIIMDAVFSNCVIFEPKDIVSGDFYWWTNLKKKKYSFLAAIDCTGHGVPGAFMSMIGNRLLGEIINERDIYRPSEILEYMNQGVVRALKQNKSENDDGMDVCLCRLEPTADGKTLVTFCGAKRPLYYIAADNKKLETIKGDLKAVGGGKGYYDEMQFHDIEIVLNQGDRIYLTTDGLADQNDGKRKRFTYHKMVSLLEESFSKSIEDQGEILKKELDIHQSGTKQRDDITFLGVEIPKW